MMHSVILLSLTSLLTAAQCRSQSSDSSFSKSHELSTHSQKVKNPNDFLYTGWYYITDSVTKSRRQLEKTNEFFYVSPKPITSAKNITQIIIYNRKEGGYGLIMKLGDVGTNAWSSATYKSINKKLGFILDNKLLEVDYVAAQITGGTTALTQGAFSKEELENFKKSIEDEKYSN